MKSVTSIRLLSVFFGLLLMVCFVNPTTSQAQAISYSGDAHDYAYRQGGNFYYGNRLVIQPTGGSLGFSDFFTITPFGCIGNDECLNRPGATKGITLMVNGANNQSDSVAKVDFLRNLNFYDVTIAADWLISMTTANCPAGQGTAYTQIQFLSITGVNDGEQIPSDNPSNPEKTLTGYHKWITNGVKVEVNDVDDTSSGNKEEITACALVLTNLSNGDQLKLGCSHADVACRIPCDSACTYTQGYYKNHESTVAAILAANPNTPLTSGGLLRLGNNYYTAAQLDMIYETPVRGNGLVALAHQLITAELNLLKNGAFCTPDSVEQAITDANTMIGNRVVPPVGGGSLPTSQTSSLNNILDNFNNGRAGVDHCD